MEHLRLLQTAFVAALALVVAVLAGPATAARAQGEAPPVPPSAPDGAPQEGAGDRAPDPGGDGSEVELDPAVREAVELIWTVESAEDPEEARVACARLRDMGWDALPPLRRLFRQAMPVAEQAGDRADRRVMLHYVMIALEQRLEREVNRLLDRATSGERAAARDRVDAIGSLAGYWLLLEAADRRDPESRRTEAARMLAGPAGVGRTGEMRILEGRAADEGLALLRSATLEALAAHRDARARDLFLAAVERPAAAHADGLNRSEALAVRKAGVRGLRAVGGSDAVAALGEVAAEAWDDDLRRSAVEALGHLGDDGAIPALLVTWDLRDPVERIERAEAMLRCRSLQGAALLTDLLEHDDARIRQRAILALQRFTADDLGFGPFAEPAARAEAVARWRARLARADGDVTAWLAPGMDAALERMAVPGDDPNAIAVRASGLAVIERLTRRTFDFDPAGPGPGRLRALREAGFWWARNRPFWRGPPAMEPLEAPADAAPAGDPDDDADAAPATPPDDVRPDPFGDDPDRER